MNNNIPELTVPFRNKYFQPYGIINDPKLTEKFPDQCLLKGIFDPSLPLPTSASVQQTNLHDPKPDGNLIITVIDPDPHPLEITLGALEQFFKLPDVEEKLKQIKKKVLVLWATSKEDFQKLIPRCKEFLKESGESTKNYFLNLITWQINTGSAQNWLPKHDTAKSLIKDFQELGSAVINDPNLPNSRTLLFKTLNSSQTTKVDIAASPAEQQFECPVRWFNIPTAEKFKKYLQEKVIEGFQTLVFGNINYGLTLRAKG